MRALMLSLLVLGTLVADDDMMMIDSAQADYDGRQITLSGSVIVEHDIGKITANHMVVTPEEDQKKVRLAYLKMNDDVRISLKDGAQLSCSTAELDYVGLRGRFLGGSQHEYVVYTENCKDKAGVKSALLLKSRLMSVKIGKEEGTKASPKSMITEMVAENNVTVNYNNDFIAASDYAMYQRHQPNASDPNPSHIPGLISLRATDQNGVCQVTNRNGDLIRANQICIDTNKRHLFFAFPKGAIYAAQQTGGVDRIDFSSDSMTWDEPRDLLTLHDHVVVNQKGVGRLSNEKEVLVYQYNKNGKKQLRSVESVGKTLLDYIDEDKGMTHHLVCHHKAILDHEHLQTILESPVDENGNVLEGKQVYFQDALGEVYADKAILDYDYTGGHNITPRQVTLIGNVRILNRKSEDVEETGTLMQYALADKVEFYPETHEMVFSSTGKKRVLFYDKGNNVKVSATALKIKREPGMKSESIQGVGDVRFSFADKEFDQIRKQFNLDEK